MLKVVIGSLEAEVTVHPSPADDLIKLIEERAVYLKQKYKIEDTATLPPNKGSREAYKAFGKKPACE